MRFELIFNPSKGSTGVCRTQQRTVRLFYRSPLSSFVLLSSVTEVRRTPRTGWTARTPPPCFGGGALGWYRGNSKPRLHMRFSMRFNFGMRFLLQNAPYPTPHGCFFSKHRVDWKENYQILVQLICDNMCDNICPQ